ncbi:hypothetical protein THIOM_003617, partial [Candidatus Thiomargarita nelsonii]
PTKTALKVGAIPCGCPPRYGIELNAPLGQNFLRRILASWTKLFGKLGVGQIYLGHCPKQLLIFCT